MPNPITLMPDTPTPADTTVPAHGWIDGARATVEAALHTSWLPYATAALLLALLALSLISRRKRDSNDGAKQGLTRADRLITRVTGILATAVVATGAWKVFGLPALHLHSVFRVMLFFFAEAQIIAAWRRVRRHIHRHAELGPGTRTVYGIALGSALVAAFDASALVEVLLRFFAAFVAAYMIVEELAEELDIHLTANPHLRTEERKKHKRGLFGLKWSLTPERIFVWLRLAEPTERSIEQVERQRRIARFARTAYRLHTLKENDAAKWRVRLARWQLRRQTEAGNEHLNLAGDTKALRDVRSQLALLYGAESGTAQDAVSTENPLEGSRHSETLRTLPAHRSLAAKFARRSQGANAVTRKVVRTEFSREFALGNSAAHSAAYVAAKEAASPVEKTAENAVGNLPTASSESAPKRSRKPAAKAEKGVPDSVRKLTAAFARKPDGTNPELARLARVSVGSANRYLPQIRAAAEKQTANSGTNDVRIEEPRTDTPANGSQEPASGVRSESHTGFAPTPLPTLPLRDPESVVHANGHPLTPEEN